MSVAAQPLPSSSVPPLDGDPNELDYWAPEDPLGAMCQPASPYLIAGTQVMEPLIGLQARAPSPGGTSPPQRPQLLDAAAATGQFHTTTSVSPVGLLSPDEANTTL